jgi:hypothetical protein
MKEGRKEEVCFIIVLNGVLGAVYTCDSAYESPYIRFRVRFPAQGGLKLNFLPIVLDMFYKQLCNWCPNSEG